jgi:predicted RNA-binding protein with PIN domain
MLLFIIDGFNLIHKVSSLKTSANPQLSLIHYIKEHKLTGSANNKVVIVFDGMPQIDAAKEREFEIIFSQEKPADDLIKERILKIKKYPKHPISEVIVASDDREIRDYAKKEGAVSQRASEFLRLKVSKSKAADEEEISYPLQAEITEELRKIWLKE